MLVIDCHRQDAACGEKVEGDEWVEPGHTYPTLTQGLASTGPKAQWDQMVEAGHPP